MSSRRAPGARQVAQQHLAHIYGVPTSSPVSDSSELRHLRAALEQEQQRQRATQEHIEQLQGLLSEREEESRVLRQQLTSAVRSSGGRGSEAFGGVQGSPGSPRLQALERENAQLRAMAQQLQGQRDAFEGVARQLQSHAVAVEAAFTGLQGEAQELWAHVGALEEALRRTKRTQTGYEMGLANLFQLLSRQQDMVRR